MTTSAPDIDKRTVGEIAQQVQDLIKIYAPAWDEVDSATGQATGLSGALIGIFARFSEIVIQRLNQTPQKNFLAYLDMLGASLLPPQPARVPLTFFLSAGSTVDGLVPAGTQVAAPPAEGEKAQTIFETERELVVTAAQLASLCLRDPQQDQQADRSSIVTSANAAGALIFQGDRPIDHILYLGHSRLLSFSHIVSLRLVFEMQAPGQDPRMVSWELWDGAQWQRQAPISDLTVNLSVSGGLALGAIAPLPLSQVNGIESRWLRGRLLTPITIDSQARLNMVRATDLPNVRTARISVRVLRKVDEALLPEAAFTNALPIELGKDFFPFGEKPKLNDAFYLASTEAFSKDSAQGLAPTGAQVSLDVVIANSHLLSSIATVRPSPDLQLSWECWNGATWERVGTSNAPGWLSLIEVEAQVPVTTDASVVVGGRAERGTLVVAQLPSSPTGAPAQVVRVGEDGRFALTVPATVGLNVTTFTASLNNKTANAWAVFFRKDETTQQTIELSAQAPPLPVDVPGLNISIDVNGSGANQVVKIRVTNGASGFTSTQAPAGAPLSAQLPVALVAGRNDLLIEGISAANKTIAAMTLSIGRQVGPPSPEQSTGFIDGTYAFCQSGMVTLTLPKEVAKTIIGGQENFWLRVRLLKGDYGKEASYKLKNPESPADGFTLILESFRPPSIQSVRIGYQQTLTGPPEVMLAYNNSAFVPVANAAQPADPAFQPFSRAPEDRPTLYAGFTLPPDRLAFPNRAISLYAHVEGLKYGERAVPISPDRSREAGDPGAVVTHKFYVTNAATTAATFTFSILGTRWGPAPVAPAPVLLAAGETKEIDVPVTVPGNAPLGSSDLGYLQLMISNAAGVEYTVAFITFAGIEANADEQVRFAWEYWNGKQWYALTVRDDTENFTRPGLIEFLAPADLSTRSEFDLPSRYWLRVRWVSGDFALLPRLQRMLLNTMMAAQTVTIRNETLGSSDGSANQAFHSAQTPVLAGQRLEVREPEKPSSVELAALSATPGDNPITTVSDAAGRPKEIWVRWLQVPDFYGSGPRDRHYVLDRLTGEIHTGDGINGLIPSIGTGNIRLAAYQTGGGRAGNKPAGVIVQMKTTVPYIDKVTNTEAAAAGADAEALDSLLTRAPRELRHGGRAVTPEDYEDLAILASPEVARAKCIPLRNLIEDPLDEHPPVRGEVSVIILPRTTETKLQPSLELLSRVNDYLEAHSLPTAHVSVVGPLYIRVDVKVEIALTSLEGASAVEQAVQQSLASFLHPLTGGLDADGWDFGRRPHLSDLYALIEEVPGVDHLRSLETVETEDVPGVGATGRFLVFSGTHTISLVFES
jgi:Baseplate J-like protein